MRHNPEWELRSSKSVMLFGFISMMYQWSVPREVAKKAKLRIPQTPAVMTRAPKVTFMVLGWGFMRNAGFPAGIQDFYPIYISRGVDFYKGSERKKMWQQSLPLVSLSLLLWGRGLASWGGRGYAGNRWIGKEVWCVNIIRQPVSLETVNAETFSEN